jgi:hypothetical protein
LALTSRFGGGTGAALTLDCAFQARDVPKGSDGQQERLLDEVVIGRPDRINGAVELGGIGGAVREQVTTTRRLRSQPAGLKARV